MKRGVGPPGSLALVLFALLSTVLLAACIGDGAAPEMIAVPGSTGPASANVSGISGPIIPKPVFKSSKKGTLASSSDATSTADRTVQSLGELADDADEDADVIDVVHADGGHDDDRVIPYGYFVKPMADNVTAYDFARNVFLARRYIGSVNISGFNCTLPFFTPRGFLCSYYQISSQDEFDGDAKAVFNMCGEALDYADACAYACNGTMWSRCKSYYTLGYFASMFHNSLLNADKLRDPVAKTAEYAHRTRDLWRRITRALARHWDLLAASGMIALLYVHGSPVSVRVSITVFAVLIYLVSGSWGSAVLAGIIGLVSAQDAKVHPSNVTMSLAGWAILIAIVVIDAVNSLAFSAAVAAVMFIMFLALISAFFHRRLYFDVSTIMYILLVASNMYNGFSRIIKHRANDPFIGLIIFLTGAGAPYSYFGAAFVTSQMENAASYATNIINATGIGGEYYLSVSAGLYIIAYFVFVFVRTVIGFQITSRMRDANLFEQMWRGFLLVYLDWWVFPEIAITILTWRDTRKLSFLLVVGGLKFFELFYAWDMLLLSMLLSLLAFVFDYKPFRGAKFLASLHNPTPGAYKCLDSVPWIDLQALSAISRNTVTLDVTDKDGNVKRGVGLLARVGNQNVLSTVHHVVSDATLIKAKLDDVEWIVHAGEWVNPPTTSESDPAVLIPLDEPAGMPSYCFPDIQVLSEAAVSSVRQLFVQHPVGMGNFIGAGKFTFKLQHNVIEVAVDLQHGDSGCPLFAVTETGAIYLAGAVSRGIAAAGARNIISMFMPRGTISPSAGSDGQPVRDEGQALPTKTIRIGVNAGDHRYNQIVGHLKNAVSKYNSAVRMKKPVSDELASALQAYNEHFKASEVDAVRKIISAGRPIRFNFERTGPQTIASVRPPSAGMISHLRRMLMSDESAGPSSLSASTVPRSNSAPASELDAAATLRGTNTTGTSSRGTSVPPTTATGSE